MRNEERGKTDKFVVTFPFVSEHPAAAQFVVVESHIDCRVEELCAIVDRGEEAVDEEGEAEEKEEKSAPSLRTTPSKTVRRTSIVKLYVYPGRLDARALAVAFE